MPAHIAPSFIAQIFALSAVQVEAIQATLPATDRAVAKRNGGSPAQDLIVGLQAAQKRTGQRASDIFTLQADLAFHLHPALF